MAADGSVVIEIKGDAKEFTKTLGSVASKAASGLKEAGAKTVEIVEKTAVAVGAAVAAAGASLGALAVSAMNSYGEYEQLVGGVETLLKASSEMVMEYD